MAGKKRAVANPAPKARAASGGLGIQEDQYRADFELLDRYQACSAEIVRLSLLGMAGLAFFLVSVLPGPSVPEQIKDKAAGAIIGLSSLFFGLAAVAALAHRYFSTDGMFYHLKEARLRNTPEYDECKAKRLGRQRNAIYRTSHGFLTLAAWCFGIAAFCFVLGFGRMMWVWVFGRCG